MVAGTKLCPECGASITASKSDATVSGELVEKAEAASSKATEKKKPDVVELHSSWKGANSIYTALGVAETVVDVLGVFLFILAVFANIFIVLKVLLGALGVVLCIIGLGIALIRECNEYKSVTKLAERKGYTTSEIVKVGMLEDPESKGIIENISYSGKIRVFAEASYYEQQPAARTKEIILDIVRNAFTCTYVALLTLFVHSNFKTPDDIVVFLEKWPLIFDPTLFSGLGLLVTAIVLFVINRILARSVKKLIKAREEWIKDEYSGIYEEGFSEYLQ